MRKFLLNLKQIYFLSFEMGSFKFNEIRISPVKSDFSQTLNKIINKNMIYNKYQSSLL